MKHLKKVMALVIAVMMMAAMAVTAFAEDYTITITAPTGHTYEVYQIFTGVPKDGQLTSLKYGKNARTGTEGDAVSQTDMAALKTISDKEAKGEYVDDQARIAALTPYVKLNADDAITTITSAGSSEALAPGYYIIKDVDGAFTGDEDSYTLYMFKVLDQNLTISAKSDKPSALKNVKDINDSEDDDFTDWQYSADHEIGDLIPYQLTFKLPSNYADYEHYYVLFKDDMCKGLTLNPESVKIAYGSSDPQTITFTESTTIQSAQPNPGKVYTYEIRDLKAEAYKQYNLKGGDMLTITYTAYLNDEAKFGATGNPNEYTVEFSNNPNSTGDGSSKPETGETPKVMNIVFTYKAIFNKVDEDNNPLEGADFILYKKVGEDWIDVTELGTSANPKKVGSSAEKSKSFAFEGLDDGDYKLVESYTPDGYNTIAPIEFKVVAQHIVTSTDPKLQSLEATGGLTIVGDSATGTLETSIENKSGAVLPSTGGIGTTLFYIIGAVLVLGSGVLLITRKRMRAN